ncbi:hypothetical protein D9M68_450370 [compost metagenome]
MPKREAKCEYHGATDVCRARTHPHDAIALYHQLLPVAANRGTSKARYDEAFEIVRAIGSLRTSIRFA